MRNLFSATVTFGVVSTCGDLTNAQELVQFIREIGAELRIIAGEEPFWATTVLDIVVVSQNVTLTLPQSSTIWKGRL